MLAGFTLAEINQTVNKLQHLRTKPLSDKTKIRDLPWGTVRLEAMQPEFEVENASWFESPLTQEEKELVR